MLFAIFQTILCTCICCFMNCYITSHVRILHIIIYNRLFNTKFTLVQQRQVIKQKGPYTSRSSKADTSLI